MPTDMNEVGRDTVHVNGFAIAEFRALAGVSQRSLATGVEITPQYLCKIETGRTDHISTGLLARIVRVLRLRDRRALLADPHAPTCPEVGPDSPKAVA